MTLGARVNQFVNQGHLGTGWSLVNRLTGQDLQLDFLFESFSIYARLFWGLCGQVKAEVLKPLHDHRICFWTLPSSPMKWCIYRLLRPKDHKVAWKQNEAHLFPAVIAHLFFMWCSAAVALWEVYAVTCFDAIAVSGPSGQGEIWSNRRTYKVLWNQTLTESHRTYRSLYHLKGCDSSHLHSPHWILKAHWPRFFPGVQRPSVKIAWVDLNSKDYIYIW